jgi:hypothetical protein
MPDWFDSQSTARPSSGGDWFDNPAPAAPEPQQSTGFDWGGTAIGGLLLGGAALLARRPGMLGKAFNGANAVRQQLMLSGLALPKSIAGGLGAVGIEAAERGSTAPLKALFSRQTLTDVKDAYRAGGMVGPTPGFNLPGPNPGKVMGAVDVAMQKVMQRGGATAAEAEANMLQTPLQGDLAKIFESAESKYIHPFRRTPFNQFIKGWETVADSGPVAQLKGTAKHARVFNTVAGAGAVHGAATSDDQYPTSVAVATALAAKYGLPYALAAMIARNLAGAKTSGGIAGSVLPVSEYGLETAVNDPLKPFTKPAFSRFWD